MRQFLSVLFIMVMIPYMTTMAWTGQLKEKEPVRTEAGSTFGTPAGEKMVITVRQDKEVSVPVEEFLIHVLAAQIPAEFGPETLKAQAVLARTYIYDVMNGADQIYEEELDMDALSREQMEKLWGEMDFAGMYVKLQTAVKETEGMYLLYEGKMIEPLFCYASAGKTRSRGDEYPYLKQAESPGDLHAEGYRSLPVFTEKAFAKLINSIPGAVPVTEEQLPDEIQIVERDGAGYVKQVKIGQKTYTGEEVQYALGLASSCYSFEALNGKIRVSCKGIGHGYGFSQFGANELEKEGKNFEELLSHYFQNIEIGSY